MKPNDTGGRAMKVTLMDNKYNLNIRACELSWNDICSMIENPPVYREKGHNAIVGGECTFEYDNDRKRYVNRKNINRCLVLLDADSPCDYFFNDAADYFFGIYGDENRECNYGIYTTYSATAEKERCRVVIPLSRTVTPEEYTRIARVLMYELPGGFSNFDVCGERPNQVMFLPSKAPDGYYSYEFWDMGEPLDVDFFLNRIDSRYGKNLPSYRKEFRPLEKTTRKIYDNDDDCLYDEDKNDPRTKDSIVGSFYRAYTISEAIEEFLSEIYSPDLKGRYKYIPARSQAGGIIKNDDLFFYSFHSSDPVYKRGDVNAYDLVMIHLFGDDSNAMYKWASELPLVAEYERERRKRFSEKMAES